MFLKQHFYHQHIRKAIIAFGTIFNQLTVERKNSAGEVAQHTDLKINFWQELPRYLEMIPRRLQSHYLELVSRLLVFNIIHNRN